MLTLLLYYISIWCYVMFICFSVVVIVTLKVFKLIGSIIMGNKIQNLFDHHPDIFSSYIELMTYPGFKVQEYKVKTEDDCLLVLWRIVNVDRKIQKKGVPVLFMHGLIDCGLTWFGHDDLTKCFPYVLALQGYDVWIGNNRGTKFTKNESDREGFWQYTFDQLAKYDITKIVSTVLQNSSTDSLVFIGHSQGSLQLMAAITQGYIAEEKVKAFIGLGPVLSVFNNTSSLLLKAITKIPIVEFFIWLGFKCILLLPLWSSRALALLMCNSSIITQFGIFVINFFCGFPKKIKLSHRQQARIFSYEPGGCSLTNILHWKQFAMGQKMKYFDYSSTKNMQLYKQESPPEYSFHKIMNLNFRKLVFIGTADVIMKHSLISREYYNKNSETVILQDYNHNDYMWSSTADKDVYAHSVKFLNKQT